MPAMTPAAALLWSELIAPTLNAFALAGSLIGMLIGIGLLVSTDSTLAFCRRMNRRISMRQATRVLEVSRDVEGAPGARHPWLGAVFVAGGAYASFMLLTQLDAAKTVAALGVSRNPVTAEVLVETLRWFLIVGGAAAVVFGAMLLFFPRAWGTLEASANRWHSTRQMMRSGDEMHLGLDRWVERFPRASGALIGVLSTVSAAAFAILLFR
jgi:hypothetical protein